MSACSVVFELNASERARQVLAPTIARLHSCDERVGYQIESFFTTFWQLARKADDMMDYSSSSDLRWLQVLQQVFRLCSGVQIPPPPSVSADAWSKTVAKFFDLMSMTCMGEVEDLQLAKRSLSDSLYNRMVLLKTGPWFTGRIECAVLVTGSEMDNDLIEYGNLSCLAYQIRNDIRDAEVENKDIAIGKLNYPTVLMLQNPSLDKSQAIRMAASIADAYEEGAKKIARRYGKELELLTGHLCSPSV
ncbi:MAG: polyprenyl synthetase family protein [Nitrososphaera sp.]